MAIIPSSGWTLHTSQTPNHTAIVLSIPKSKLGQLQGAKSLQLITGKAPCIRYGRESLNLTLTAERFVNELYHTSNDDPKFYTNTSYRARITQPQKDDALIALQQSLADYSDQKKASRTQVAQAILPEPKNRFEAAKQSKKGGVLGLSRQLGSSPSLGASPALAPTSAYHDNTSPKTKALRHAVIHLLAMRPLPAEEIAAKVRIPVQELKGVLQTLASLEQGKWQLSNKACKELDVWRFKYPKDEDRQAAIDTAIRAYDRLRLSKDDKLWQQLLPKAERGQGKVLSRLHLGGAAPARGGTSPDGHPPAVDSPRLASQGTPNPAKKSAVIDRLLSKDPKKARAEVAAKDKKRKERDSTEGQAERPAKRQATKKAAPNAKSSEFVYSSDDDAHSDSKTSAKSSASDRKAATHAKEQNKVNSHVKGSASSSAVKESKASKSTATVGKLTPHLNGPAKSKAHISPPKALRPTIPSPLGAARPRVASDVSDRSGISQRRNGIDTPKGLGITSTTRARHDTITGVDTDRPKLHKTAMDSQGSQKSKLSDTAHVNGHHKTSSVSSSQVVSQDVFDGGSSDSSMSVIDTITFNQGVDLAMKFQDQYYPQYAKFYDSIHERQVRGEVVSSAEIEKLWEMHKRLQQMKTEIEAASERGRRGNES